MSSSRFKTIKKDAKAEVTHSKTSFNPEGRPKKNQEDKLTKQILIRVTEEQNRKLDEASNMLGISKSALIKSRLIDIFK